VGATTGTLSLRAPDAKEQLQLGTMIDAAYQVWQKQMGARIERRRTSPARFAFDHETPASC
jgi:hypothetical protein